jgi:hypothetical protein
MSKNCKPHFPAFFSPNNTMVKAGVLALAAVSGVAAYQAPSMVFGGKKGGVAPAKTVKQAGPRKCVGGVVCMCMSLAPACCWHAAAMVAPAVLCVQQQQTSCVCCTHASKVADAARAGDRLCLLRQHSCVHCHMALQCSPWASLDWCA